jgi:hypothetical protein
MSLFCSRSWQRGITSVVFVPVPRDQLSLAANWSDFQLPWTP